VGGLRRREDEAARTTKRGVDRQDQSDDEGAEGEMRAGMSRSRGRSRDVEMGTCTEYKDEGDEV
jgi:hypothetical protein